ncbi:MAG TPA: hypothetical protein VM165_07785, partial [Planctomycetaceae bacterium]|nr:hypothetical protein [Planctomycetaceae bacterium]
LDEHGQAIVEHDDVSGVGHGVRASGGWNSTERSVRSEGRKYRTQRRRPQTRRHGTPWSDETGIMRHKVSRTLEGSGTLSPNFSLGYNA